jgi:hypothetical protein
MRKLARTIEKELQRSPHCAIYQNEITRVWPRNGKQREEQIAAFAKEHGWFMKYYNDKLCAIFVKESRRARRAK